MTVEVQLNDSEALVLRQKAHAVGQELSEYVGGVVRRDARRPLRSLQQIAGDIEKRRGGPLGMNEAEIGEMLEVAKHEMRAQRHQQAGQ